MPSTAVEALVAASALRSLSLVEYSAKRDPNFEGTSEAQIEPVYELDFGKKDDGFGFRVIFGVEIEMPFGQVRCSHSAVYETPDFSVSDIPASTFQVFINDVAVMQMLPFMRQAVADLTQRAFDAPLLMPMMPRGTINFELAEFE